MRIAKAIEENRYGKAKSLQWLLVRSYSAKLLAIKRVTESKGSNTPGVDKEVWHSGAEKYQALQKLCVRGYRSQPLRRIYIPKRNGKRRPLSIPTMQDRAMQALFLLALLPVAEVTGDKNSYGFRPERSTHDACHQCYIVLSRKSSAEWVLEADIEGCFDNISHLWLMENIPIERKVLKQWINAGYIEKQTYHQTDKGTPQGGVISPVLANMVLDGLENVIKSSCPKGSKVNFIRYADDFVVTASTPELLHNTVMPIINEFLKPRGLKLSPEKTKITHINDGFDFLGFNVRKYKGKYLSKPSKESVLSIKSDVKSIVKRCYGLSGTELIKWLNPKITGWGNYYRGVASKATFSSVDSAIFKLCLSWALRKYSRKRRQKAVQKYFRRRSVTRGWIFSDIATKKDGKKEVVFINQLMDIKIQRHVKIRSEAHPFSRKYHEYFSKRNNWKKVVSDRQRGLTKKIYRQMQRSILLG